MAQSSRGARSAGPTSRASSAVGSSSEGPFGPQIDERVRRRRREALVKAKLARSREMSTRGSSKAPHSSSWHASVGSPHGPCAPWALLGAFEKQGVFFHTDDDGAVTFQCLACEVDFTPQIWHFDIENEARFPGAAARFALLSHAPAVDTGGDDDRSDVAHRDGKEDFAPSKVGGTTRPSVDGSMSAAIAERLLIAKLRHHCASALHVKNFRTYYLVDGQTVKTTAPRSIRDLEDTHVIIRINGIPTLANCQFGGNAVFDDCDSFSMDDPSSEQHRGPTLYSATSVFSHPSLCIDHRAAVNISFRGTVMGRPHWDSLAPRHVLTNDAAVDSHANDQNPAHASYGVGSLRGAGRLALIEYNATRSASQPTWEPVINKAGKKVFKPSPREITVLAVDTPLAGRDDTSAEFVNVRPGASYRLLRATDQHSANLAAAAVTQLAPTSLNELSADNIANEHINAFVNEQTMRFLDSSGIAGPSMRSVT